METGDGTSVRGNSLLLSLAAALANTNSKGDMETSGGGPLAIVGGLFGSNDSSHFGQVPSVVNIPSTSKGNVLQLLQSVLQELHFQPSQQLPTIDPQQLIAPIGLQQLVSQQQQLQNESDAISQAVLLSAALVTSGQTASESQQQMDSPFQEHNHVEPQSSHNGNHAVANSVGTEGDKKKDSAENDMQKEINALREAAVKRGSKILPCRARGMPADHIEQYAFLEVSLYQGRSRNDGIPSDLTASRVLHGLELVCSYPCCRNKGIKFKYCFFCDDAISKRCFRPGHNHDDRLLEQRQEADRKIAAEILANIAAQNRGINQAAHDSNSEEDFEEMRATEISSSEESSKWRSQKGAGRHAGPEPRIQSNHSRNQNGHKRAAGGFWEPPSRRARVRAELLNGSLHEIMPGSSSAEEASTSSSDEEHCHNSDRNYNRNFNEETKRAESTNPHLFLLAEVVRTKAEWDALLGERQEMESDADVSNWMDRVFAVSKRYRDASERANATIIE